jgi:hypothetical protein
MGPLLPQRELEKLDLIKLFSYKQVGVILYVVYRDKKISQETMPPVAELKFSHLER